ncbi:hypothetical protein I553_1332 [Mycobacterium xenopi 4042]|uniref:Uncharacterized protein n=1 Tax=Mycobacterium xenopi 4042 TaxID=1299334 RepID=X8CF31_MYCXE|nr:hypothetical protein I553_1332 [Mycobacterium xenopi 4042]
MMSSVSIGALLELALVCAIPYLATGAIVAGAHGEGCARYGSSRVTTCW